MMIGNSQRRWAVVDNEVQACGLDLRRLLQLVAVGQSFAMDGGGVASLMVLSVRSIHISYLGMARDAEP